ncbi:MAG TPA: molybdate ABC transporter substrate-binding protein [Steroidobacteraceae bacterium]|nr:molybdate ABC transporter substrate-binding protein [Steroidobacteraceae bacterium]
MGWARRAWLILIACFVGLACFAAESEKNAITVYAAASLTNVLQDLGDAFTKDSSIPVRFSFAASSALARQIENGARADIFFSADLEWMDYLQARNLIQAATRHDVVGNDLVLIAPVDSKISLKIEPHFALAAALGKGRLATGDPDSVPVGRYAHEALAHLGVWDQVEARLVRTDSVRSALAFVDRGEAALGIVYATDARIDKHVRVVDMFPPSSHRPIVYPAALAAGAKADAAKFLTYVRGPAGDLAFRHSGFAPLH